MFIRRSARSKERAHRHRRPGALVLGASAAVTTLGGALAACPGPGGCLQCGLCAGLLPMAALSLLLVHFGRRK